MMEKINWDDWEECTAKEAYALEDKDWSVAYIGEKVTKHFKRKAKTVWKLECGARINISKAKISVSYRDITIELTKSCGCIKDMINAVDEWSRRWGKEQN